MKTNKFISTFGIAILLIAILITCNKDNSVVPIKSKNSVQNTPAQKTLIKEYNRLAKEYLLLERQSPRDDNTTAYATHEDNGLEGSAHDCWVYRAIAI